MTKKEAQEMVNAVAAKNKKIAAINEAHNEGGDGFELDYDFSSYDIVKSAGYALVGGIVYDRDDFEAIRKKWNDACNALKGQKVNVGIIAAKSGVNAFLLTSLKGVYA